MMDIRVDWVIGENLPRDLHSIEQDMHRRSSNAVVDSIKVRRKKIQHESHKRVLNRTRSEERRVGKEC